MAEYLQQEANTDHLLLEDGSGGFLLETSQHTATVTGGGTVSGSGAKNAFGSATVSGGGSISSSGTAFTPTPTPVTVEQGGGNVHMPPPRRRLPAPQPVPVLRFGSATVTGGGTIRAAGRKHASGEAAITGGGTINATGYKSSEIALVRYQPDGSITTEPARVLTLEEELQHLVEDAAVLAEALN
jgi:hypothetical protein